MLSKMFIEYEDGLKVEKVVHNSETSFKTKSIKHASCQPFKYKVDKHPYLCVAIVRYSDKTMIMPAGIPCHSKTTLEDIIEIDNTPVKVEETTLQPKQPELKTWKFESASGGGTYVVKETKNGSLKCDCPGTWRAKDRRCKHIKEVEKELGIEK
jgi:hypothetical protein